MKTSNYFLIIITIFAFYQMFFFYLIRPYYAKKITFEHIDTVTVPEVAFEVVYLFILILGFAVAPIVNVSPYLLWGIVLLVYSLSIKRSRRSFFLASALLFKTQRNLGIDKQLKFQANVIFTVCLVSGTLFTIVGYLFSS